MSLAELPVQTARAPYRHAELRRLLHPSSIAVIGASTREGSFGLRTLRNLSGFDGRVYPVNAKYDRIDEHTCYPSLDALPESPDCVAIAVNRDAVENAVRDCVRKQVGGVIIYASGYSETRRADLVAMQDELLRIVAASSTRLIGPNCLGITNYACKARILFGRMPEPKPLGANAIAVIAQSGSVSMSLGQAVERGVSISHAIPVGNAADVGIADLVSYLVEDDACRAIACVFEGVADADRLIRAANDARAADKPLVVYKMAVGEEGAAAALSHTGSLAGSHAAYRAALLGAGAVMVDNMEDVIETAAFFAKAGRPRGRGAAVVLGSGGLGVIAADKAEEHGLPLQQPEGETLAILKASVPEFGAPRNPCDVTAQALNDEKPLEACASAMLADPAYSALLVVHPYADAISLARVPLWSRLAEKYDKVICNYWSTEALQGLGAADVEREPRIATFRSLNRCFAALAAWHDREKRRGLAQKQDGSLAAATARGEVARLFSEAKGRSLTEREAKRALALYGVPVVPERLARSADEAARAAIDLGFPVALKLESPDILHKTEAKVIRLKLASDGDVRQAYDEIMMRASAIAPAPRVNGVLVQPMARSGVELMMGARVDPQFGPLLATGLGGVMVELMNDVATAIAPVTPDQAQAMLRRLKGFPALNGFRGAAPVNIERLAEIVARFSEFVADHARAIAEVDVNPLICAGDEITAVDALIVLNRPRDAPARSIEEIRR